MSFVRKSIFLIQSATKNKERFSTSLAHSANLRYVRHEQGEVCTLLLGLHFLPDSDITIVQQLVCLAPCARVAVMV
jgi:hypothetical protein